jgi:hypothetical protein
MARWTSLRSFCCCCGALLNADGEARFLGQDDAPARNPADEQAALPLLNPEVESALRIEADRRNARKMLDSLPLCPNCVHPMRLTRRIEPDATYRGQNVFECNACRVALTQPQPAELRTPK